MPRQVFLLDLRDEALVGAYDTHHRPGGVPNEVITDILSAGVQSMQIFRLGTRLVMITESDEETSTASRLTSQASRDWEALMDGYQLPVPGGLETDKWRPAQPIFDLREHTKKDY